MIQARQTVGIRTLQDRTSKKNVTPCHGTGQTFGHQLSTSPAEARKFFSVFAMKTFYGTITKQVMATNSHEQQSLVEMLLHKCQVVALTYKTSNEFRAI